MHLHEWTAGNKDMKEREKVKNIKEAANCYTHALSHIDTAIQEAQGGDDVSQQRSDLRVFKSIVYSNRAQSSLLLKNYHECIKDSEKALELNNNNTKARYRKAKSLYHMKKFYLCKDECGECILFHRIYRHYQPKAFFLIHSFIHSFIHLYLVFVRLDTIDLW